MSTTDADAILALAASTALPGETPHRETDDTTPSPRPFTRSQALSAASAKPETSDRLRQTKRKARRQRASDFAVFIDPPTSTDGSRATGPAPKRSKTAPRIALSVRTTASANSTPMPSPRTPETPFPFSCEDPLWENIENYGPSSSMPTALSSSGVPSENGPFVTTPSAGPPPHRSTRRLGARLASSSTRRSPALPRSMELYSILGLSDFDVGSEEITAAYRRAAFEHHPDRANENNREEATVAMQQLNAARDLLLNEGSRRQYHIDGRVPWANTV
ncbi:hypothetical protein IAQ61_001329 [Plenodomus lingam]|uniref:J domain-containing protein n=1 Tax=Leptosphaeria maculans (strain JN3 / isolate v23.1.3 / race Av1-4-5-6-7-8) TaxID=985895 RepID=E4ZXR1_LEPMJ|nr:hypothetical protein LEMA_P110750.1 [Plenodomus lingam JN3]KAH9879511.1 hypothetical protein IAQ61_001329 [Plenodomus lingam]CBX96156.1 hypothetical protein LEMA_P110750.1 [Plenodomus lingam JN3]